MKVEEYMMLSAERAASVRRRIEEKTRADPETGCIEWIAKSKAHGGYGTLCVGRRGHIRAHRAAWVLKNGPIPDGMYVCHECDNPACCNPDHLFIGTPAENMADKERKGRGTKPPVVTGESHHNTKITTEDVLAIMNSTDTLASLSSRYGISGKTVWRIKKRLTWGFIHEDKQGDN